MKKGLTVFLVLALLLTLTACGKKETVQENPTQPPVTEAPPVEILPERNPVEPVEIEAWETEGRLPGGEYDLPEELTSMQDWQWSGAVALLVKQEDVAFYAVEGKESSIALLRWGDSLAEFDWLFATPRAVEPDLWVYDVDGDGEDEVVADCYGGSGTGVSMEYIYVVEKSEDGTLTGHELPWQGLATAVNEQMQLVALNGRTYAALGRELVDITALLEGVEAESVCLGQTAAFRPTETGLTCTLGVVAEGEGIPFLSRYVAEVTGELRYENGTFVLENLHLLS